MPHIALPEGFPGIRGPMQFRPETARPINALVDFLLREPNSTGDACVAPTLRPAERELIAAYVSSRNECRFCHSIHGAVAAHHLSGDEELVACVKTDFERAGISGKLKALLAIAGRTAEGGTRVTAADIERARQQGATDLEIHDTVLIAAVFSMCNRYVDGLATTAPEDPAFYRERAALVAEHGYTASAATPSPGSSE